MPTPFDVERRRTNDVNIEGHVFKPKDEDPWLAHLILYRTRGPQRIGVGRDSLAGLLRFVAEHDPDLYSRMGVAGLRARVDRRDAPE